MSTTAELNVNRRRSLLHSENVSLSSTSSSNTSRVGKVAGVTVVECAAICCCPCAVFNFLVLTFYRLPAGLCRRAICRHRSRRKLTCQTSGKSKAHGDVADRDVVDDDVAAAVNETDDDVAEMEKDMWERFNGAGFWRSASQRMKLNNPL